MNYKAKDLPYNQFEKIGLSKREVLALPPEDLKALLTGRTTNLQTIQFKNHDVDQSMQVKLSVQRFPDGSLNLMVHPIRKEIQNDDKLSEQQLAKLKQGETVIAPKTSMNGEKELHLYQLDRETNEIVKTRLNSIAVPRYLMDIELSPKDRSILLQGETVNLEDRYGKKHKVAIDLIDPKGYSITNIEQKLEHSVSMKEEQERTRGVKR